MESNDLTALKRRYSTYAARFLAKDAELAVNTRLKINHTARVRLHILRLAKELKLPQKDRRLAEAIALLHDVGRFAQYERFRTFDDRISADHAAIGLEIMQTEGCLHGLPEADQEYLKKAVALHNKLHLPEILDRRLLLMVHMLRDADKLDIFDVILKDYRQDKGLQNPVIDLGLPDTEGYQQIYVDALFENRIADNQHINNANDLRLVRLSWVFDLNFAYAVNYILKIRFVECISKHLPDDPEISKVRQHLLRYLTSQRNTEQHDKGYNDYQM